ncbi:MAG: MFS transporter [Desulfobacterales bacterium]|nr:MFS transporter [Desulfobacterales bacterium]
MNPEPRPYPPLRLAWLIWGLAALFYVIGFFHRLAPAVMTRELMRDFDISAAALGNLSGFYFYSYWLMQIPTGVLVDSWGARRLLTFGALGSAAGAVLFALSGSMTWACVGRLLIGGCVSVAYVVTLKLAVSWFPVKYFSMISGLGLLAGILGAVTAGVPLRLLVDAFGWRPVMLAAAAATGLIAVVTWVLVRDDPKERGYRSYAPPAAPSEIPARMSAWAGIGQVFRYANTRLLFFIPASLVGSVLTFCGLWGVPYLTTHYGLSTARAAFLTSLLMICWASASPLFGWLSDRLGRRKPLMILGQILAGIGWAALFYAPGLSPVQLTALSAATGLCSASFIICWSFAKESVPAHLAGTIAGVINMGVMLGATVLQPAVGWMLDRRWEGALLDGVRIYSRNAYQAGFGLMMAWILIALVLLCCTRETFGRQAT